MAVVSSTEHDVMELAGGVINYMRCCRCVKTSLSLKTLLASPCQPPTVDARHVVEKEGSTIWCGACGARSAESNRREPKFRDPCRG